MSSQKLCPKCKRPLVLKLKGGTDGKPARSFECPFCKPRPANRQRTGRN